MKNIYYRFRNFREYWNLFGLSGTYDVVRGMRGKKSPFSVRVPGLKHPVWIRQNNSDFTILKQSVVFTKGFVPRGFKPKVLLDLGANVGLTTAVFASRWPEARILAIEPDSVNYSLLKTNCELFENVEPIQAAIWHCNENVFIENSNALSCEFRISADTDALQDPNVPPQITGITIPTLLEQYQLTSLDIVKIDIEGTEKLIFAENSEEWLSKVGVLIIELHDRFAAGCSDAVFNAVESFHPTHFKCDEYEVFQFEKSKRSE